MQIGRNRAVAILDPGTVRRGRLLRQVFLGQVFLAAALLLAACASPGPTRDPFLRTVGWFAYVGGDDIRAACGPSAGERYRAVYNANYTQQVRTYDVIQSRPGETAVLFSRVFQGTALILRNPGPGRGYFGTRVRTFVSGEETEAIRTAFAQGGAFAPGPGRLFLRSDTFYWTVAACSRGQFSFRAFKAPPEELSRLAFAAVLFQFDETGAPVRAPRLTPADARTNFGRISESDSPGGDAVFELEARPGGLR